MDEYDSIIDAALDSYPLDPVPSGFTRQVMSQIVTRPAPFRLDFLDLALPVFFTFFFMAISGVAVFVYLDLNSWLKIEIQANIQALFWKLNYFWFFDPAPIYVALGAVLLVFFGACLFTLVFFWRDTGILQQTA